MAPAAERHEDAGNTADFARLVILPEPQGTGDSAETDAPGDAAEDIPGNLELPVAIDPVVFADVAAMQIGTILPETGKSLPPCDPRSTGDSSTIASLVVYETDKRALSQPPRTLPLPSQGTASSVAALPAAVRQLVAALGNGHAPQLLNAPRDPEAGHEHSGTPGEPRSPIVLAPVTAPRDETALERLAALRGAGRRDGAVGALQRRYAALATSPGAADAATTPAAAVQLQSTTSPLSRAAPLASPGTSAVGDAQAAVERAIEVLHQGREGQAARIAMNHNRFGALEMRIARTASSALEVEMAAPPAELRTVLADSLALRDRIDTAGLPHQASGGTANLRGNAYDRERHNEPRPGHEDRANRGRDERDARGQQQPQGNRRGKREPGFEPAA